MSEKVFTGKTLNECLETASFQLNIPKENLKYKILEEKKSFFVKKVSISVEIEEVLKENKNGSIKVEEGNIIVKNPKEGGKPALIKPMEKVKVLVDEIEINSKTEVFEDSKIEVFFDENTAERRMNVSISPDKMEAYISIKYIPQNIYTLDDMEESRELKIYTKVKEQKYPNPYTESEILEQLAVAGIKCGVIKENLNKILGIEDIENVLIAKGIEPIDGIDDEIQIKFQVDKDVKNLVEDKEGRIDYKSIGHIDAFKKGDILAVRIEGKQGRDGIDVKGGIKKHRTAKKYELKAGEGCELKDENTVVAAIEGKPSCQGNVFSVHQVHIVEKDVELKTGNIDFIGDVIIYGSVKEGMKVNAGHNLTINKNLESAKVHSKGDVDIQGSIINSTVSAGGEDIEKLNKLKYLNKLDSSLSEMISTIDHIKKFNLLGKEVRDGEIVKVLIENKFKHVTQIAAEFIKSITMNDTNEEKKLASFIKQKLIGFAPLSIRDVSELGELIHKIEDTEKILNGMLAVPVNVKISYCQDSVIKSSGNIIITGKGEYVSKITAHESIEFISPGSLARGGVMKAKNEIKCKSVGSEGGVSTKLMVESHGSIWADIAYQNTCFVVGGKEYTLETASKDVHAYLNDEGEIVVDKFIL